MNGTVAQAVFANDHERTNPDFRVVIAYESIPAGRHAVDVCNQLVREFDDFDNELHFGVDAWSFEALRDCERKQMAVQDPARARFIIIAAQSDDLPDAVKEWIQAWLREKNGQATVLVSLLDQVMDDTGKSSGAHGFLKNVAASAGIDFLSRQMLLAETPALKPNFSNRLVPAPNQNLHQPPPPSWGIND